MIVKNRTLQNRSKHARLVSSHIVPTHHVDGPEVSAFLSSLDDIDDPKEQILYSLGSSLVAGNSNPALGTFLSECEYVTLEIDNIPSNAFDLLGSVYQYLNSKKENLEKGTFYTGEQIATDFVGDLDFSSGQTILDPACGSGSFLFRSEAPANSIYGIDLDPIAIMIAKFNYFIKFPDAGPPNLFVGDFFDWFQKNNGRRFNYVIGNPPYGANMDLGKIVSFHIRSNESYSYFIEFGYHLLEVNGVFRYLLPESLLNVRKHADARAFILDHANLRRVKKYPGKFSGVMSDVYMIELDHGSTDHVMFEGGEATLVPKTILRGLQHSVLVSLTSMDVEILEKVNALRNHDLSHSIFGLGVVTGDNKTKLLADPTPQTEQIYTGKEVERYRLLESRHFIVFDRSNLQQVAPDEIYRAPQKLIYKTISKYLKVALDDSKSLSTNSANILIPKMPGYDAITVMAFLNSDLYSYLHFKLFGGVNKIAKENLMALPFPAITEDQRTTVTSLTTEAMRGGSDSDLQRYIHEEVFGLTEHEVEYLRFVIS